MHDSTSAEKAELLGCDGIDYCLAEVRNEDIRRCFGLFDGFVLQTI